MARICFVGTYPPMTCGIGDYTYFITRECPKDSWSVVSFDLINYGKRMGQKIGSAMAGAWYGMKNFENYTAEKIMEGVKHLNRDRSGLVLWFQHEHGIWRNDDKFIDMLRALTLPKIVTLHTLHFQSNDTESGLRKDEERFLTKLLPNVDAITVFSHGVQRTVEKAFPQYRSKVHLIKHGIHGYAEIARIPRREARQKLSDFLLYGSSLSLESKKQIYQQGLLTDERLLLVGQAGFIDRSKQTELLYWLQAQMQRSLPQMKVAAIRLGSAREDPQRGYAQMLQREYHNGTNRFMLDTLLPPDMIPVAQRAFDLNFCWPRECTQSGILAHALGAGAIVAGRAMEGVGETLRDANCPVDSKLSELVTKTKSFILNPNVIESIEAKAMDYAGTHSWPNQMSKHFKVAQEVMGSIRPQISSRAEIMNLGKVMSFHVIQQMSAAQHR